MSELRLVPCPSTEVVLLESGALLLVPVRGGEQLEVDAPWGLMVHDVVVLGRPVADSVALADRPILHDTICHLAERGYLIPQERVAAADVAAFDRQVRWFAQEGVDGPAAQRRLADSTVLVIGVGGFGAALAEVLARAGVGRLVLVDNDRLEEENIPRQLLYSMRDVGVRKAFAAAERLEEITGALRFEAIDAEICSADDVADLVRVIEPDLVVCAADRPPISIKGWLDEGAFEKGYPVLHGGSRPPYAYVGPLLVPGTTPCYGCFYNARMAPGADEVEAAVNEIRDANPPTLPAAGWADISAATLAAGQAVAFLSGIHDVSIMGREREIDVRTLDATWVDEHPGRTAMRCARCDSATVASER